MLLYWTDKDSDFAVHTTGPQDLLWAKAKQAQAAQSQALKSSNFGTAAREQVPKGCQVLKHRGVGSQILNVPIMITMDFGTVYHDVYHLDFDPQGCGGLMKKIWSPS